MLRSIIGLKYMYIPFWYSTNQMCWDVTLSYRKYNNQARKVFPTLMIVSVLFDILCNDMCSVYYLSVSIGGSSHSSFQYENNICILPEYFQFCFVRSELLNQWHELIIASRQYISICKFSNIPNIVQLPFL